MPNSPKTWAEARAAVRKSLENFDPVEEAEIQAGIDSDPDNPELTEEDFGRMVPSRPSGRPKKSPNERRAPISFRWSRETIEALRATGPGWNNLAEKAVLKALKR